MTTEIDAEGKRDLNAALQVWMDGHDPRAVMADSPMGNFIAGFYAARGWTPRARDSSTQ